MRNRDPNQTKVSRQPPIPTVRSPTGKTGHTIVIYMQRVLGNPFQASWLLARSIRAPLTAKEDPGTTGKRGGD